MSKLNLSDAEVRMLARRYALTGAEARELSAHPDLIGILERHQDWRLVNGLPADSSPLSRGVLLDMMRGRFEK